MKNFTVLFLLVLCSTVLNSNISYAFDNIQTYTMYTGNDPQNHTTIFTSEETYKKEEIDNKIQELKKEINNKENNNRSDIYIKYPANYYYPGYMTYTIGPYMYSKPGIGSRTIYTKPIYIHHPPNPQHPPMHQHPPNFPNKPPHNHGNHPGFNRPNIPPQNPHI